MAEPWLDSLSEDWNSQPRSSPSASLPRPNGTPVPARSRIPLATRNSANPLPQARAHTKQTAAGAKKRGLSERSLSDINIPPHSSPSSVVAKASARPRPRSSLASSTSSTQSIVKCKPSSRRSRSSSPAKSQTKLDTPEWKRLVMKRNLGKEAQNDLFGATDLENMFQQPNNVPAKDNARHKKTFTLQNDLESMPSSPPPWPQNHRGSRFSLRPRSSGTLGDSLAIVREQEEDDHNTEVETTQSMPGVDVLEAESIPDLSTTESGVVSTDALPHLAEEVDGFQCVDQTSQRLPPHDSCAENSINTEAKHNGSHPMPRKASSIASGHTSSITGGFSPVFISKHNTVDGHVDYAAVDLSDPEVREQLKLSLGLPTASYNSNVQQQAEVNPSSPAALPQFVDSTQTALSLLHNPPLPEISEFVNIERGGHSDEGSFRRRPLSPSPSSSIVPSDSVSQTHDNRNGQTRNRPTFFNESRVKDPPESQSPTLSQWPRPPVNELDNGSKEDELCSNEGSGPAGSVDTVVHLIDAIEDPHRTQEGAEQHGLDQQQAKRPLSAPTKHPTPKRQRILGDEEPNILSDDVLQNVKEQHRQMQAIIGKRKDARYENDHVICDSVALARRDIVRPRNPTPSQQRGLFNSEDDLHDSSLISSFLDAVQNKARSNDYPRDSDAAATAEIMALATEVATFRMNESGYEVNEVRKQSVSTKDYVDEAMKIMEFIRARKMPRNELSNLQEIDSEGLSQNEAQEIRSLTPQSISRPPSRDGRPSGWRSRDAAQLDPSVAEHLAQYQENEDFTMSSAFGLRHIVPEENDTSAIERDESFLSEKDEALSSRDMYMQQEQAESPIKTYSSHQSTDSTGRTIRTVSSQGRGNVQVIAPEKVSHLLRSEEAGMRYDEEKKTWVKCKASCDHALGEVSSSTGTEDDPFGNIPDLAVNEAEEFRQVSFPHTKYYDPASVTAEGDIPHTKDLARYRETTTNIFGPQDYANQNVAHYKYITDFSGKMRTVSKYDEQGFLLEESTLELPPNSSEAIADNQEKPPTKSDGASCPRVQDRPAKVPTGTVLSKRRDVSVFFSSPPVSREYEIDRFADDSYNSLEDEAFNDGDCLHNTHGQRQGSVLVVSKNSHGGSRQLSQRKNAGARNFSLSRDNDVREISFIGKQPDGRTMSLTLSVSTPLPSNRRFSGHVIQSSALRSSRIWHSLSPLSDFSLHQDDSQHLKSRHLLEASNQVALCLRPQHAAVVVNDLVEKLTDIEPDEPYWDFMRHVSLSGKNLDNLHKLDEFCPRVEELDVSNNSLRHLIGAPSSLRHLYVQHNHLSSLSTWNHLVNLQYLDISGNDVESVEGFANLVHLRELKADNNRITCIEGLLDLDGLISLSLKSNRLAKLDFEGSELKRLEELNIQGNSLDELLGLHCLPALRKLDGSDNELTEFPSADYPTGKCLRLQSLSLSHNKMEILDVSWFPSLRELQVDSNRLAHISNLKELQHLQTLSMRFQEHNAAPSMLTQILEDVRDIRNLYVSGNNIPSFSLTAPVLNLQNLELAFAGLQSMPQDIGSLAPNLRTVNLNSNSLKDLKPLRGVRKLEKLHVAGNRLTRLRKTLQVVGGFEELRELDLRDNPLTVGFYSPVQSLEPRTENQVALLNGQWRVDSEEEVCTENCRMHHLLPRVTDAEADALYTERLDEDTKLRRRVYELLLTSKCEALESVDGRGLDGGRTCRMDGSWERLIELGIVERKGESEDVCV